MDRQTFDAICQQLDTMYGYFPEPKKIKLEKAEQNGLLRKRPNNPTTTTKKPKTKHTNQKKGKPVN